MKTSSRPSWIKDKKLSEDFEVVNAPLTDPIEDFRLDPSGFYVLIKIVRETEQIAVAVCNREHEIVRAFQGYRARDIWSSIFAYEQKHNLKWFTLKSHAAYLGKELKKAELALVLGCTAYFQE